MKVILGRMFAPFFLLAVASTVAAADKTVSGTSSREPPTLISLDFDTPPNMFREVGRIGYWYRSFQRGR
jgi:hypothetical protein